MAKASNPTQGTPKAKASNPTQGTPKAKASNPTTEALDILNAAVCALDQLINFRRDNELSDTRARNARNTIVELLKTIREY